MIYKIYFVGCCCCVLVACMLGGVLLALPIVVVLALCGWAVGGVLAKLQHKWNMEYYASLHNNIYEYTKFDGDFFVEKRAKEHERFLLEAGNLSGVVVHRIIFRDLRPFEKWEDFEMRRDAFIEEDSTKRAVWLSEKNRTKYVEYELGQRA